MVVVDGDAGGGGGVRPGGHEAGASQPGRKYVATFDNFKKVFWINRSHCCP